MRGEKITFLQAQSPTIYRGYMMKHSELFSTFLSNIEPDEEARKRAQEAHIRVRANLEKNPNFKQYVVGSFLYGSYKRETAVGDIKDVDIVILTSFDIKDEENTPTKVLKKLKTALVRFYENPDAIEYQRRSIRVDEPLPERPEISLTLDLIPAVAVNGEDKPLYVPDRESKKWVESHPKGHIENTTALNKKSDGHFVRLVKIIKWWWKYQCEVHHPNKKRPKPKGFWLECLVAQHFKPELTSHAEHFIHVLESVVKEYGSSKFVPKLKDPGLPNQGITTSLSPKEFDTFIGIVKESLYIAQKAIDEPDKITSSELWRDVFGEMFPLPDGTKSESYVSAKSIVLGDTSHAHEPIWAMKIKGNVRIYAKLFPFNTGIKSDGRRISNGTLIRFEATTNIRGNYDIYWQVVNTGKHASSVNGLRGEMFKAKNIDFNPSPNQHINWEHTSYTGKHYVICFVVQNGVCVAQSEPFYVNIRNPSWKG